jgi:hypothetical protein
MTEHEQALRTAIADKPIEGPWQVRMVRDKLGCTGYRILTHSHAAICVAAEDYYAPEDFPETDDDGYYQPDTRIDSFPHRIATGRFIAAANPVAMQAILDELDRARGQATRWEQRARSLGWPDEPNG